MKYIVIILFYIPIMACSQTMQFMYNDIFNLENHNCYVKKPEIKSNSRTTRTKIVLEGNDTIRKYIDLEIIDQGDRRIKRTYIKEGTLDETVITKVISPNEILEIYYFVDVKTVDDQKTTRIYNNYNQLIIEHTKWYTNDSLDGQTIHKTFYNKKHKIVSSEYYSCDNLVRIDTFIYNYWGYLLKSIARDDNGKLISFKIFNRINTSNYPLSQITSYNSDSLITSKILPPPLSYIIDSNIYIKKFYRNPDEHNIAAVYTEEYQKVTNENHQGFKIIAKAYQDHWLSAIRIFYYDEKNRLIKYEYKNNLASERNIIWLYKYLTEVY